MSAFVAQIAGPEVFGRPDIVALMGDRAEGPDFLSAFGKGHALTEMQSVVVEQGGRPVAVGAVSDNRFDLFANAPKAQRTVRALRRMRPKTGIARVHGMGGIQTGEPQVVISGDLGPDERDAAFLAMLDAVEAEGRRRRVHLHAVLELSVEDAWATPLLRSRGYWPMLGVPMAWLHLPYTSMKDFLASRSRHFRQDRRRNLRRAMAEIEVSETSVVDAALDAAIEELIASLHAHSRVRLGGLEFMPPGFHRRLAEQAPDRVRVLQYRLDGRLVGISYMICEGDVVLGKNLGLSYPEAADYRLVDYNMYRSIEAVIGMGKQWLVLGQSGYPTKLLYKGRLVRRTSFLKGRGILGPLLSLVAGRLDDFSLARQWPETQVEDNYFDAHPELPQPPVKRIWSPR